MNVTARCACESEDISDTLARDLAEVDYFLRDERAAMRTFMHDLTRGAFTSVDHLLWRWPSCSASMRIATRDVRHFAAVRLASGGTFDLVVLTTELDRS